MTEKEYVIAANRVRVSNALQILRDVMTGSEYGISSRKLAEITQKLAKAETTLFALYKCAADDAERSQ